MGEAYEEETSSAKTVSPSRLEIKKGIVPSPTVSDGSLMAFKAINEAAR
jgi:hypothetical protein